MEETISDGAALRSLKNLAHPVTKHFPSSQNIHNNVIDKPVIGSMLAMYLLKKNLNKKEQQPDKAPLSIEVEAI
jgi:hypothetical protein